MTSISTMSTGNPYHYARPMAAGNDGDSSAHTASISANDFLTLLVTEMKNQDPTAQTDPNEYVNQLVQVNSLEQLIEINESVSGLGTASGSPPTQPSSKGAELHFPAKTVVASPWSARSASAAMNRAAGRGDLSPVLSPVAGGNLGAPQPVPAAQRVARSLSGFK